MQQMMIQYSMTVTHSAHRELAVDVVNRLQEAGYQALWAGGCVRDYLLGREPQDYDVATSATPDQVRELFGRRRTLAVGASFGVIVVLGSKAAGQIEVATFRTEGDYQDGRRPSSVEFTTAEEDAHRRDFTINGMFYDPVHQQVLDYVGGENDLGHRIIRAIGNPHDRMQEDKLRMLRAVRFTATLDFRLDEQTAAAIKDMAAEIQIVSAERITQEFKRMLVHENRVVALTLCRDLGLLSLILPELTPSTMTEFDGNETLWEYALRTVSLLHDPSFELAFATLLVTTNKPGSNFNAAGCHALCKRFRLSNQETNHICWLFEHQHDLLQAPDLSLAQLKRLFAHNQSHDLLAMMHACTLAANADLHAVLFCEEFLERTPPEEIDPPLLLSGDNLVELGYQPGPEFKAILDAVRDAQLNGEIATEAEAKALVPKIQNEHGN